MTEITMEELNAHIAVQSVKIARLESENSELKQVIAQQAQTIAELTKESQEDGG